MTDTQRGMMNGTVYHGDLIAPAWKGGYIVRGFHNPVETFATEEDARRWIDAQATS